MNGLITSTSPVPLLVTARISVRCGQIKYWCFRFSMILGKCGTRDLDKLDGSCTTSKSQSDQGIAHCCQNCLFYNKVKLLTIKLKMDNKPTCKLLMFTAMSYWSSFILICRPQSDWSSETWNLETHMIQKMRHLSLPKITWHWQELSLNSELEPQIYCNQKT